MLPGKLCIGILEEDNPLKSYFRLKPVLVLNEGKYERFTESDDLPSEGCLRIVPDKNESGRFKARMRRMGRYCILDLREHPDLNDKIRANKNFGTTSGETNANIVYSDVVREPVAGMIIDIAADSHDESVTTDEVLIGSGLEIYRSVSEASGDNSFLAQDGTILDEHEITRFEFNDIGDHVLRFAVRLSEAYLPPITSNSAPKTQSSPTQDLSVAVSATSDKTEPVPETESSTPIVPSADESAANQSVGVPENKHNGTAIKQLLASRVGLNPTRRMSLQEIIDDKWCRSREDQLGHPINGSVASQPMESPVDIAVRAISESWRNPETRKQLTNAILDMRDVAESLDHKLVSESEAAARKALENLEVERLMAITEIEHLRKEKAVLRETFKAEIRVEEANAFRDAVNKTKGAQKQLEQLNAQIEDAKANADALTDILASLKDGRFEAEIRSFALKNRCIDMIMRLRNGDLTPTAIPESAPDRSEWFLRTRSSFSAKGLPTDDKTLANYLVCSALASSVILSGPSGSDRKLACDALAQTLSADAAERYVKYTPQPHSPVPHHICDKFASKCDVPGVLLVSNANLEPRITPIQVNADSSCITVFDISDTGSSIDPEILENSWFLRIPPISANAPWYEGNTECSEVLSTASMQSLRDAFLCELPELPSVITEQMTALRLALADYGVYLSRKCLNDMWQYCGAMIQACPISIAEAFDRAFAQRALPFILATASIDCLKAFSVLLKDMPVSAALLKQPLPIGI